MPLPVLDKRRWASDDPTSASSSVQAAVMARTFAMLYASGATLVLLTLALPYEGHRHVAGVLAAVGCAYAVVALLMVGFDRLPSGVFLALPPLGTVLVSVVVVSSGPAAFTATALMFFWVVLSAFYFFGRVAALANLVWVAVTYAILLRLVPGVPAGEIDWVMAVGALTVTGAFVAVLRHRVDFLVEHLRRQARQRELVAALGDRALRGTELPALLDGVAEAAADALDASLTTALQIVPGRPALVLRAGRGWRPGVIGATVPVEPGTLPAQAFAQMAPIVYRDGAAGADFSLPPLLVEHGARSGIAVPFGSGPRPEGLLGVHSHHPDAFDRHDVAFMQSLATVVTHAIDRARSEEEIRRQALFDPLTDQPNRNLLVDRLSQTLVRAAARGSRVAVLFVDVDNFKVVNDSLGHQAGDELLVAFAPRLREALYVTDTVARFGGDEFVVLCEDVEDEAEASAIARRLQQALVRPFPLSGGEHQATASIGVALGDGTSDAEALLRDADTAMYRAKSAGRARSVVFDRAMRDHAVARLDLERDLRVALRCGQLSLAYQPIVSLADGSLHGCEALLRWQHPRRGAISPAEFIPLAEDTAQIVALGRWVVDRACRDAAAWRELRGGHDVPLAVNFSPRQIAEPSVSAHLADVLAETGVSPDTFTVEITEGVLLGDTEANLRRLRELKELGVRLVLDDFGTGYSSLGYLKQFAVDGLKIDRAFVDEIDGGAADVAIVEAVIAVARALRLGVVAEGVERAPQLDRLRELGCELAQGYRIARPMPAAAMTDWLRLGQRRLTAA